jgi:hypothetical protein
MSGRFVAAIKIHLEAVHLDEQLIQRLLALVVAAAETRAAVTPDGVDLVHEDDARRGLLRLLEEVAHARRADADEHLDEVGARDREERDACLARDRAREQRLTGTRRPVEQDTLRDRRAEGLELLRVLEELLDLLKLFDRLVDAGDILEADLRRVGRHALRTRLAEAHHLRAAALHLVHQEDPETDQQQERQEGPDQRRPREASRALRVPLDTGLGQVVLELELRLVGRVVNRRLRPVRELERDRPLARVEDRLGDLIRLHTLDRVRRRQLVGVRRLRDQRLAREPDQQDDHEKREERAAEETIHVEISSLRVAEWMFVRVSG